MPPQKKLCFVIGPIGKPGTEIRRHADWLLKGIIKPVFEKHFQNFNVVRADEIVQQGNISSQVINRLFEAELVIADMSLANANAFYELAIRHMKRLPTIHMIRDEEEIPFDVFPYRAVRFGYSDPAELESAKDELRGVTQVTLESSDIENPITHARGVIDIHEHATEAQKVILDELVNLKQDVSRTRALALRALNQIEREPAPLSLDDFRSRSLLGGLAALGKGPGLLTPASESPLAEAMREETQKTADKHLRDILQRIEDLEKKEY
jgi:hypothetical protein